MGAVDRTEWNLITAVSEADRVLLTLPADQIKNTLAAIANELKTGCVLVDTTEVKRAVLQWATELLPKDVHLIGGHPILMVENSCSTLSILIMVIAAPGSDESKTRRRAFPMVVPKPRSSGCTINLPKVLE